MSIRTRVMVGTLGLAVVGFVGTLGAAEDEMSDRPRRFGRSQRRQLEALRPRQ